MASDDGKHEAQEVTAEAPQRAKDFSPAFARQFPADPELDALVSAYEAGHYAYVRKHAPELAERAGRAEVAEAARELRRRLDPDPLARNLLLAAVALLATLAVWSFLHHHH